MGRYNRQARRAMRKQLGAGAKISNDALETAIDIQREAMQADKLVPTMKKSCIRFGPNRVLSHVCKMYIVIKRYCSMIRGRIS